MSHTETAKTETPAQTSLHRLVSDFLRGNFRHWSRRHYAQWHTHFGHRKFAGIEVEFRTEMLSKNDLQKLFPLWLNGCGKKVAPSVFGSNHYELSLNEWAVSYDSGDPEIQHLFELNDPKRLRAQLITAVSQVYEKGLSFNGGIHISLAKYLTQSDPNQTNRDEFKSCQSFLRWEDIALQILALCQKQRRGTTNLNWVPKHLSKFFEANFHRSWPPKPADPAAPNLETLRSVTWTQQDIPYCGELVQSQDNCHLNLGGGPDNRAPWTAAGVGPWPSDHGYWPFFQTDEQLVEQLRRLGATNIVYEHR